MIWEKQGRIFQCDNSYEWSQSHAQVPVVEILEDCWRVYYSTRNKYGKSCISFFDVEKGNPQNILYTHDYPILSKGMSGTFDDNGVMPTCVKEINGNRYLYYIGWTTHHNVPYSNSIGIAKLDDSGSASRVYQGPIIGRSAKEPFFCGTCYVTEDEGSYYAYYLSCIGWQEFEGKYEPLYDIKLGRSSDGLDWEYGGEVMISLKDGEGGIASASVIHHQDKYHMWFSVRGAENYRAAGESSYRLGYAVSTDGINWERKDNNGLPKKSESGWDSEMIGYPYVIKHENDLFMFYNGNGFGRSGIGVAKLDLNG